MADGFFLGGMAKGMNDAAELSLKRDQLAQQLALGTRGLDLQELGLSLQDKRLGQDLSLRTRALDLTAQAERNKQSRELLTQADKQVSDTMSVVAETISAGLSAGRDPAVIAKAVQPLVQSAKSIAAKAGMDPAALDVKVNTLMAAPTAAETAVGKAKAGVEAAKAVTEATGVPQREALQGQGVLRAEPRSSSVMESIRGKIAEGQPLTGGEQKVYDDALKADPLARFLALSQGANAPAPSKNLTGPDTAVTGVDVQDAPAAPAAAAAPATSLPPAAAKQLKEGVVTTFANGQKWTLVAGKPKRVP